MGLRIKFLAVCEKNGGPTIGRENWFSTDFGLPSQKGNHLENQNARCVAEEAETAPADSCDGRGRFWVAAEWDACHPAKMRGKCGGRRRGI